jgi:CheY-like chemotaxis protein
MDKKALILVVDDNLECRKLLEWILELHGFRTISAACGLDAVKLAIDSQPSLVLMDLSMPDINGHQAARSIHAHCRGRRIPIVAVSTDVAGLDYRYASRDFKASFVACLGKPWEGEELLQLVTKILDRRRQAARVPAAFLKARRVLSVV